MAGQADIRLEGIGKAFGAAAAVRDVTFSVAHGEFVALLGPSGCGKSTTLRMIAGLEQADEGSIFIGGRDVTHAPSAQRGIAMVFQSYALFPHLSVRDNIAFGLSVRKVPKDETKRRLDFACDLLGLGPYLERKPSQLSGGQQQRVALGRAIVAQAPVCLMDEPLSNLDAQLRAEMRREIRALQQRLGMTMIYVTHDQIEAMTMADRIILMNAGRIEQDGAPDALYSEPSTVFSARFIGTPPMNVAPLSAWGEDARRAAPQNRDPAKLFAGLRPEALRVASAGVQARVVSAEYLGADTLIEARLGDETILVRHAGKMKRAEGESVAFAFDPADMHFFDEAGKRIV